MLDYQHHVEEERDELKKKIKKAAEALGKAKKAKDNLTNKYNTTSNKLKSTEADLMSTRLDRDKYLSDLNMTKHELAITQVS